jgi:hypothetical protein
MGTGPKANNVIVITGQRGTGKTTLIKERIRGIDRVILFDLLGEFEPNVFTQKIFFEKLSESRKQPFFRISYFNPKTTEEDFERICKAVNRLNDLTFVVDELDYFCSASFAPPVFQEIIKRGRHQGIGLICATRRPHEIPRLVTSQVTELISFRQVEPRDLAYLKDICGLEPERVQSLADFHYLRWTAGKVEEGETKLIKLKVTTGTKTEDDDFLKMFRGTEDF